MSQGHSETAEQIETFLADRGREVGSDKTMDYYRSTLKAFHAFCESRGITDASKFTPLDWNAYTDELRNRMKIESVKSYLRGAKVFLGWLDIPMKKNGKPIFKMPKAPRLLLDTLTEEDIDTLEAAATNERDRLIVRVLWQTGIRLSELTGLHPEDLREVTSPTRYYLLRVLGKGGKERDVPVDWPTFKRLIAYVKSSGKRTYVFSAHQWDYHGERFVPLEGDRLGKTAIGRLFRILRKRAGIKKPCSAHKLRHAYATEAKRKGMDDQELMRILGHTTTALIASTYAHLDSTDLSRAYERTFGSHGIDKFTSARHTAERQRRRRVAV